jgi:murein DD-endopeptidase / murein LD-carboxypeptidase
MQTGKNIKTNRIIMSLIAFLIGFPLVMFLTTSPALDPIHQEVQLFDTSMVAGYHYFTIRDIEINENSNIALYNEIYPRIGIPHRSRAGRDGLDCSQLVKIIFKEVFDLHYAGSSADILRTSQEIPVEELSEGDLVFFKIEATRVNHVGIYLNNSKFVHASSAWGVTINDLNENYYQRYFFKAARARFQE